MVVIWTLIGPMGYHVDFLGSFKFEASWVMTWLVGSHMIKACTSHTCAWIYTFLVLQCFSNKFLPLWGLSKAKRHLYYSTPASRHHRLQPKALSTVHSHHLCVIQRLRCLLLLPEIRCLLNPPAASVRWPISTALPPPPAPTATPTARRSTTLAERRGTDRSTSNLLLLP